MNTETVTRWMHECAVSIAEQRDYLTQLDAAIGDADHGTNMNRGFTAVEAKMDGLDGGTPPGRALMQAGSTLVSTVGGASGPLWGSALRRAGKALGDSETFDAAQLVEALRPPSTASSSWERPSRATRRSSMRSGRRSPPSAPRWSRARRLRRR